LVCAQQNVKNLPFTNAALAASVGKTVEDFESMEVTRGAVNVVFDGLMESAAGLIPPDVCDRRRDALVEGGELNEAAFQSGLFKVRHTPIFISHLERRVFRASLTHTPFSPRCHASHSSLQ
tara:strand:+ start:358 stop:720 length:363 start_codon:yes stop_codon:yes gene_type:complete